MWNGLLVGFMLCCVVCLVDWVIVVVCDGMMLVVEFVSL